MFDKFLKIFEEMLNQENEMLKMINESRLADKDFTNPNFNELLSNFFQSLLDKTNSDVEIQEKLKEKFAEV